MYDLIVKGGRIYDGSGMPSFNADVAVRDGRIAAIGRVKDAAEKVIDAVSGDGVWHNILYNLVCG